MGSLLVNEGARVRAQGMLAAFACRFRALALTVLCGLRSA
jgi:hypothetical protein